MTGEQGCTTALGPWGVAVVTKRDPQRRRSQDKRVGPRRPACSSFHLQVFSFYSYIEPGFIIIKEEGNFFIEVAPTVQKHYRGDADKIHRQHTDLLTWSPPGMPAHTCTHSLTLERMHTHPPKNTPSPFPPLPHPPNGFGDLGAVTWD